MAENLGSYAVNIPKMFQSPGEALQAATAQEERFGQRLEQANFRNQQAEERKAKELEAQRQRSMAMIQSGVRLDRMPADEQAYMVAQDAVSKVKSNLMAKLNNKSIDPIALQTEIDDAMKGITRASNTFILEHNNIDEVVNQVAKNYPSIDAAALKNDLRSDVRNRRIAQGQFIDPNQVEDSALIAQLSNPENLSKYITEYNTLDKVISGKESSRPIEAKLGTPQAYTTFSGKMGFWNKPTFEVEPSGFIKKGGKIPSLTYGGVEIANEPLPANSLRGVDKPLDMVPQGAYDKFLTEGGNNAKSEIVSLAQKQFTPEEYKTFSPQEKDFANRNALYNYLKKKDTQGFVGLSETSYNPPPSYAGPRATEGEKRAVIIGKYLDTLKNSSLSGNEDDITNAFDKFYGLKGGKYEYDGVKVVPDKDGKISQIVIGLKDKDGIKYETLDVKDKNFKSKLGGVYQKISGSETAAEIKDLNDLEIKNPSKGKKYIIGKETYTYDELKKAGWTDAQLKELSK
jgi:hypothetical protein